MQNGHLETSCELAMLQESSPLVRAVGENALGVLRLRTLARYRSLEVQRTRRETLYRRLHGYTSGRFR